MRWPWQRRPRPTPIVWTCRRCGYAVAMPPLDVPGGHHMFNSRVFLHVADHQSGRILDVVGDQSEVRVDRVKP